MLCSSILGVVMAFTAASTAAPNPPWGPHWGPHSGPPSGYYHHGGEKKCLTDEDAQIISDAFFTITGGKGIYNKTVADAILSDDFSDSSMSVASIVNGGGSCPISLTGPTFASKDAFNAANEGQPRTEFKALNLYHNCETVIQRFEVTNLSPLAPRGISIFETVPAPAGNLFPYQIKQVYGELDSIAWLVDEGVFKPAPSNCSGAAVQKRGFLM